MKNFVKNFLNSGFEFDKNEQLLKFRFVFFNSSIFLISLVLVFFSAYRFSIRDYPIGVIDAIYSIALLLLIWKLRQNKKNYDATSQHVVILTFITLIGATIAGQEINILSWYVLFVIIAFVIGGIRSGITSHIVSSMSLLVFMFAIPEVYAYKQVITLICINTIITFTIYQYDQRIRTDHNYLNEVNKLIIEREHETLRTLSKLAEYKDSDTGAHVSRVSEYSRLLAEACELDTDTIDIIFYAAPFHDMGKVGIADSILLKKGKLDDHEFEIMKTHTRIGAEVLKNTNSKYLQAGSIIAESHHEKWNGSGYPNGLSGEDIPIAGRIVAIADVFDALTSVRPYKKAWDFNHAMRYILEQSNTHFEPKLTALFKKNEANVYQIYCSHNNKSASSI